MTAMSDYVTTTFVWWIGPYHIVVNRDVLKRGLLARCIPGGGCLLACMTLCFWRYLGSVAGM